MTGACIRILVMELRRNKTGSKDVAVNTRQVLTCRIPLPNVAFSLLLNFEVDGIQDRSGFEVL